MCIVNLNVYLLGDTKVGVIPVFLSPNILVNGLENTQKISKSENAYFQNPTRNARK